MATLAIQPRSWDSAVTGKETTRFDAFLEDRLVAWATVDTTTTRWLVRELHVDAACPDVGERLLNIVLEKAMRRGASVCVPANSANPVGPRSGVRSRFEH
jgi:hypothetical protein